MNRSVIVSVILAGVAGAAGVASATPAYWRNNGLLLEVAADPRDGMDTIQTHPTRATSLEVVALNDDVNLHGMTLHFSDGREFTREMQVLHPGERVRIDLPDNSAAIVSVDLDYGDQTVDRTAARLQIIPRNDQRLAPTHPHDRLQHNAYSPAPAAQPGYRQSIYQQPTYQQPTYQQPIYQRPVYRAPVQQPTYVVRPRASWSGSISGTMRF